MAKKTNKSACGTSFHDSTVITTINKLKKLYGDPQCEDNSGEDKVNVEWDMILTDSSIYKGKVFTIYDWKEYRTIGGDEFIEFHIGGMNKEITHQAELELGRDLNS